MKYAINWFIKKQYIILYFISVFFWMLDYIHHDVNGAILDTVIGTVMFYAVWMEANEKADAS